MGTMTVKHLNGDRFAIGVRDHMLTVDQPLADGGEDTAPTPTELLVASLASCVAFYARRYLARHHLPTAGLIVTADYTLEPRPARVTDIRVDIQVPDGIPAERLDALLAVASHCTVHNTLADPPTVTVTLAGAPVATVPAPRELLH
jgi:putative redox protein